MIATSNPHAAPDASLFQRRIIGPLLELLRMGATPEKLAWSIAVGLVIGVNPLLGSTTLVSLVAAGVCRLNLIASQIATHLAYPLELALFIAFIRAGNAIFHTGRMPLHKHQLFSEALHHPWATTRLLWTWEWHALLVWALFAAVMVPLLATILTPLLSRLSERLHPQPVKA